MNQSILKYLERYLYIRGRKLISAIKIKRFVVIKLKLIDTRTCSQFAYETLMHLNFATDTQKCYTILIIYVSYV